MLIDFKFHTCNKYIHAQEVTLTKDNPILDTDLLSFKGKKLLTDLMKDNFYFSIPSEELQALNEIVESYLTDPVVENVSYNTLPLEKALSGTNFLVSSGFKAEFSTNIKDGHIQLALAPANATIAALGPSTEGVYPKASSEISVLFAVTADKEKNVDVFNNYEIVLKHGSTDVLTLIDNVWVGIEDSTYVLTDSYESSHTIQNVTRERFLSDLIPSNTSDEEVWSLTATHKKLNTSMSITVTVPKFTE